MVKKIRLIEEESQEHDLDQVEFQEAVLETIRAMDWKIWEMFKIEQERARREGILDENDEVITSVAPTEPAVKKKVKGSTSKVKQIIVDDDE